MPAAAKVNNDIQATSSENEFATILVVFLVFLIMFLFLLVVSGKNLKINIIILSMVTFWYLGIWFYSKPHSGWYVIILSSYR